MKLILTAVLSSLLFAGSAQLIDTKKEKQLRKLIDDQVHEILAPGLAIGIVHKDQVIFESYAGYADLKNKIPLGKDSRFNYASSGKQFTALAILKLIDEGKIQLTDDIRKYLPEFYPGIQQKIQIQHLLTHTSGIRDIYALWSLQGLTWWEETFSNKDAIELLVKQQQLSFTPGDGYSYSNSNYILLTEIVKQVTSTSFKLFSDNLFKELGMPGTAFEPNHADIPNRVLPYGFWKKYRMYEWNPDLIGDGALFTTLPDQLAWEVSVQQKKNSFLPKSVIKVSQKPIEEASIKTYGYGLEFEENKVFHHGSTGAYGATFTRYPEEELSIVAITNYTNISTSALVDKCYEILTGSNPNNPSQRSPQVVGSFVSVDSLLGTYKTPFGYYYRFVTRSDTLFLERTNREPVALEHEKGNIYHEINDPKFQLEFTTDPKLGMQITAYYPTHDPYTLTKQDISWKGYDYQKLNGTYYNTELDLTFKIRYLKDDQYLVKGNKKEYNIQIFEPNILWFNGFKGEIKMDDGTAKLFISSSRNRNILFTRTSK